MDEDGEVVGILTWYTDPQMGVSIPFALSSKYLRSLAATAAKNKVLPLSSLPPLPKSIIPHNAPSGKLDELNTEVDLLRKKVNDLERRVESLEKGRREKQ